MVYSTLFELVVPFTREYQEIRNALLTVEHYDKTCLETLLQAVHNVLVTNWGSQNYCQVIVFTDCGMGLGSTSLQFTIENLKRNKCSPPTNNNNNTTELNHTQLKHKSWIPFSYSSKLSFVCINDKMDAYFKQSIELYQELLDVSGQKGQLFIPKILTMKINHDNDNVDHSQVKRPKLESFSYSQQQSQCESLQQLSITEHIKSFYEAIDNLCEVNYYQFEAKLKCGGYFKLECPVILWPSPMPYVNEDSNDGTNMISRKIEVCGYLSLADIGSPMCISRHLILPKFNYNDSVGKRLPEDGKCKTTNENPRPNESNNGLANASSNNGTTPSDSLILQEYEKLENDIRSFYSKHDAMTPVLTINLDDDDNIGGTITTTLSTPTPSAQSKNESNFESVCVLLHGALKSENLAALVSLNDNWFGFINAYADGKKKSNLMLSVLPPGYDRIPWLGDFRYLGFAADLLPGENVAFPVKPIDKRSYSQNCVVWIRQAGLQSDIQKLLRHSRKIPDKIQHFYKELNRVRRNALSLGFIELLDGLANLFEAEIQSLPHTVSPDCRIQLHHSANELRKLHNRDLKISISPLITKYNTLQTGTH